MLMKCFLCARIFVHFFPRFLSFSIIKDDAAKRPFAPRRRTLYRATTAAVYYVLCVCIYLSFLANDDVCVVVISTD